jgi:hypothetical protein
MFHRVFLPSLAQTAVGCPEFRSELPGEVRKRQRVGPSTIDLTQDAEYGVGSAGLLWAFNGGKLLELHRDWAAIELPVNRSQRIFSRRDVVAGKVILPWDRA